MNKAVMVWLALASSYAAVLLSVTPAAAQRCGTVACQVKNECEDEFYPCGQNEDGTIIICMRPVCRLVERCELVPCVTEPAPIDPMDPVVPLDFVGRPVLPVLPDLQPGLPRPLPFEP